MTRIEEIEKRMAEISAEIEIEGADLDALEAEVRSLKEEKAGIIAQAEKRKAIEAEIRKGNAGVDVTPAEIGGKNEMETRTFTTESAEYRSAWAKTLLGQELNEVEKRAYSQETSGAVPTGVADMFFEKMKKLAPMLNEITLMRVAGNLKFVAEGTRNTAEKHTENAAQTPATDTTVSVTLGAFEFMKVISISKSASIMSVAAFENWLVEMLAGDIARAIENYIINDSTNGIIANIEEENVKSASAAYTYADILGLIAMLPATYDAEAKFLLNKKTLWNDVRGIVDGNKRPIFDPESNTICGYPYVVSDYVPSTSKEILLGKWKDVVGNLSQDVTVDKSLESGFRSGSIDYRGFAAFDSKPAKTDAMFKLMQAAG